MLFAGNQRLIFSSIVMYKRARLPSFYQLQRNWKFIMAGLEDLQIAFESAICKQKVVKLSETLSYWKVIVSEETGGRIALMKLFRQTVDKKIGKSEASVASGFLGDLIAHLGDSVPPLEKTQVEKDMEGIQATETKTGGRTQAT